MPINNEEYKKFLAKIQRAADEVRQIKCTVHDKLPIMIPSGRDKSQYNMPVELFCCPEFHTIIVHYWHDLMRRPEI